MMSYGAPLINVAVVSDTGGKPDRTFCLMMHHAIFDGWSYALILSAVEGAYKHMNAVQRPFTPFIKHIMSCNYESAREGGTGNGTACVSLNSEHQKSLADS